MSAEMFTRHTKRLYTNKVLDACTGELLLHSNSEGQDQPVLLHNFSEYFLDCCCSFICSLLFINFENGKADSSD